jgi:hypothetical protein
VLHEVVLPDSEGAEDERYKNAEIHRAPAFCREEEDNVENCGKILQSDYCEVK